MKFSRLQLTNFTVFEETTFEFCPGLNVLIGANGTGKSHVLKVAYAIQKTWDDAVRKSPRSENDVQRIFFDSIWQAFEDVFLMPPADLVHHARPRKALGLEHAERTAGLTADSIVLEVECPQDQNELRVSAARMTVEPADCVFIPTREFLTAYEGFVAAFSKRELAFDRTYFDLCVALSASSLKDTAAEWGRRVVAKLESELSGPVELRDGRFYVDERPAAVVAEGHRKFAMLIQLLRNGGISSGTTLYWDEPESGLNPKLVKVLADVLLLLAEQGVQIVIATHDYLLTQELSLAAEYRTTLVPIKFFCLNRETVTAPVSVEAGETLADLPQNPILEEFSALYDREQALFYRVHPAPGGAPT